MLCKSPFMIGPLPCACQRCMPCRINKKRLWTFRLSMEALAHKTSSVATLTYNQIHLPSDGSLNSVHLQKWLKRLRKAIAPTKIRYFACGEYGKNTHRPHFHVLLFGLDPVLAGGPDGRSGLVKKTWPYGNILVDSCKPEAIAYVAGYVTKKLTKEQLEQKGLQPEFLRMSLRPGIGAQKIANVANALQSQIGTSAIADLGDVPHALKYNGKTVPLGRYLRGLLREKLLGSRETPIKKKIEYWKEMWAMRKKAESDPSRKAKKYSEYLVDTNAQKVLNMLSRVQLTNPTDTF